MAHQEGKITLRTTKIEMPEAPPVLSANAIVQIRVKKLHMSQGAFAKLLGVSVRVVQSWEQGRRSRPVLREDSCRWLRLTPPHC